METQTQSREFYITVVALVALGALFHGWFIYEFAKPLPAWNDWDFLPVWSGFVRGGEWLDSITEPYRGTHYMTFPFLVFLAVTWLFGWDLVLLMYLSLTISVTSGLILLQSMNATRSRLDIFVLSVGALIIFSLRQSENILWSWQLALYLCQLCAFATFYCLSRITVTPNFLFWSICLATVGTFSFGNGILIWPVGLLQLLSQKRSKRWMKTAWIICFSIILLIFGSSVEANSSRAFSEGGIKKIIGFLLAFLGGPFTAEPWTAIYIGACLVLLMAISVFLLVRSGALTTDSRVGVWLWVGAFSLLTGSLVAFGRAHGGVSGALTSRYVTLAIPFSLCAIVVTGIFAHSADDFGLPKRLKRVVYLLGLAILGVMALRASVKQYDRVSGWKPSWKALEREFERDPSGVTEGQMLGILENDVAALNKGFERLQALNLGPFSESFNHGHRKGMNSLKVSNKSREEGETECSPRVVVRIVSPRRLQYIRLSGWAVERSSGLAIQRVQLICGGKLVEKGLSGLRSPDAAALLESDYARSSGWELKVSKKKLRRQAGACFLRLKCTEDRYFDHLLAERPFGPTGLVQPDLL